MASRYRSLHSLLTIAASHISDITSVKSQICSLNFIYLSYDFLSCNPLYLLFTALSNQFLLFLMVQIKNNYKFNILALVRKENRSKCSYLCNSFVTDQIVKMKCADTTHCQEKKITSQSQIYTEAKESIRHTFMLPRQSSNFQPIQSVSTVYLLPVTSSVLLLCSFSSSVLCSDFPAGPRVSLFTPATTAKSLQSCPTVQPRRQQPTRLRRPWDSPGKNTGVGCHFLLQCVKVKSESEVAQSCPTLSDPWTAAYQAPPSMGFSRQEFTNSYPKTKTMEIFSLTFTLGRKEENFRLVAFYSSQEQTSIFQFLQRKSLYKQIFLPFPS